MAKEIICWAVIVGNLAVSVYTLIEVRKVRKTSDKIDNWLRHNKWTYI